VFWSDKRGEAIAERREVWSDGIAAETSSLILTLLVICFAHRSFCREWYLEGLVPWVHYIPVDYLLETLNFNVRRALGWEEERRKKMVKNMNDYGKALLREDKVSTYVVELINTYTELFWDIYKRNTDKDDAENITFGVKGEVYLEKTLRQSDKLLI